MSPWRCLADKRRSAFQKPSGRLRSLSVAAVASRRAEEVQSAHATLVVKDVAFSLSVRDIAGLPAQTLAFGAR
jgi:hypothetical protein